MILELRIHNVALITELVLTPGERLSVLTGETGAGKSILLGALSLLLGERASADLIRQGCETATVEALFNVERVPQIEPLLEGFGLEPCEDQTLIVKREFSRNGRGKCLVNSGLTTLSVLQRLGQELVDLHGQHEHQSLLQREAQRQLLDSWAGLLSLTQLTGKQYHRLLESRQARERLSLDEAERIRRLDLLNFQVQEIDQAKVQPGETAALTEERTRLAHAEKLLTAVNEVLEVLHRREGAAVREGLGSSADRLADLAHFDSNMGTWADQLRVAEVQVAEVVDRLADFAESFEADPQRLEAVEERLDLLHKLGRKYGEDEEAILVFRQKAALERDGLTRQDETLEQLAKEEEKLGQELGVLCHRLSQQRREAGQRLSQAMEHELKTLGFQQSVFQARVEPREDPEGWVGWEGKHFRVGPTGADDVEFFIAPNPGEPAKPVAKTASGGELSRIMLALKVVAATTAGIPTLIFDEVDAGIGGATAEAVGRKLKQLSENRQVVVITHLAQIARFADQHLVVSKSVEAGRTTTLLKVLEHEQRVHELARLMAGDKLTETALQHARELIEPSGKK